MILKIICIVVGACLLVSCNVTNKIEFQGKPCLNPYQGFKFTLCEALIVNVNGIQYTIPQGFITDLASVPRIFWTIDPPTDTRTISAAIFHDYLYSCPNNLSRYKVDAIFYDALLLGGESRFKSFKYWLGVRLGGSEFFSDDIACHG